MQSCEISSQMPDFKLIFFLDTASYLFLGAYIATFGFVSLVQ